MAQILSMDMRDLKKLEKFFKKSPKQFKAATANILNSLAYGLINYDKIYLRQNLIVRSESFLKKALKVHHAKASHNINQQFSIAGSVRLPRFSGWTEQEYGRPDRRRRGATRQGRGGNKRNKMKGPARLYPSAQIYKPERFTGRSLQQRFYFMMRVLGTRRRGAGLFIITNNVPLKSGRLTPGLYGLESRRVVKYQLFNVAQPRHVRWRSMALTRLRSKNNIANIWRNSLRHIVNKYK